MSSHTFLVVATVADDGTIKFSVDEFYTGEALDCVLFDDEQKPVSDPNSQLWVVDSKVQKKLKKHLSRYINLINTQE